MAHNTQVNTPFLRRWITVSVGKTESCVAVLNRCHCCSAAVHRDGIPLVLQALLTAHVIWPHETDAGADCDPLGDSNSEDNRKPLSASHPAMHHLHQQLDSALRDRLVEIFSAMQPCDK
jgi:hypothetical protein